MSAYDSISSLIEDRNITFVDFKSVDLVGRWRHVTIPTERFTQQMIQDGIGFDASNFGYSHVAGSDMVLRPDLSTATVIFYDGRKVLSVISDIYLATNGLPYNGDPRAVARRAERHLERKGFADQILMSPEFEFYVFAAAETENHPCSSSYRVTPINKPSNYSYYHISPPQDTSFAFRCEISRCLEELGVSVKYHHHEVGPLGQAEIEIGFGGLLDMADTTLLIKHIVRKLASEVGLTATFMPKPLWGEPGSSMHVHQYLARNQKSLFDDNGELSELALQYIGGLLSHGPSLMALTNPTPNSYRRLVPGYEAPITFTFGNGNRSAAVRIPAYASAERRRIELRTGDATANPYLAYAAMLMAGLDGIERGLNAKKLGFGPFDHDLYQIENEQNASLVSVPSNLEEAIRALEEDHAYLLAGNVFTDDLLEQWTRTKREESRKVAQRPHPLEFEMYYDL